MQLWIYEPPGLTYMHGKLGECSENIAFVLKLVMMIFVEEWQVFRASSWMVYGKGSMALRRMSRSMPNW